jgi:stress-induced morphogen
VTPSELELTLRTALPSADIQVTDLTGTQDHYKARIVAAEFAGKNRIQQHRMVYEALGEAMKGAVHALALETYTPEAWAAKGGAKAG